MWFNGSGCDGLDVLSPSISERIWLNSVLDPDNIAPLTYRHGSILRFPWRTEFSVLSVAVSCEGLEAGPQEYSQHGRRGREHL